jgi:hypothetical protein
MFLVAGHRRELPCGISARQLLVVLGVQYTEATKEMGMTSALQIGERMEVIASCGKHVGQVDRVEGETIKLAKNDPAADGKHHFIPVEWVDNVDHQVHLKKNSEEVFKGWKTEPAKA